MCTFSRVATSRMVISGPIPPCGCLSGTPATLLNRYLLLPTLKLFRMHNSVQCLARLSRTAHNYTKGAIVSGETG